MVVRLEGKFPVEDLGDSGFGSPMEVGSSHSGLCG